jgi:hypothetical protein
MEMNTENTITETRNRGFGRMYAEGRFTVGLISPLDAYAGGFPEMEG